METRKGECQKEKVKVRSQLATIKNKIFMFLIIVIFVSLSLFQGARWLDSSITTKNEVMEESAKDTITNSTILIKVKSIKQKPELYNGCEVTSLAMLLNWAGVSVNKLQLSKNIKKDKTPVEKDEKGNILSWGDPNNGFVGDITGDDSGYAVYHGPLASLLNRYLPGKAADLSGSSFLQILDYVNGGKPVVVWTTSFFAPTNEWVTWTSPHGTIKATFHEHCVLLVGFDENKKVVYLNDPLYGAQAKEVPMEDFRKSWVQLGSQAVSVN